MKRASPRSWAGGTPPPTHRVGADADQQDEERGEQAAGSSAPERQQLDGARPGLLGQEQGGDEVPGEHKEHVDAQEPPVHRPESRMEAHDRKDGDTAQPVEPGNEAQGRSLRGSHAPRGAGRGSSLVTMCPLAVSTSVPQPPALASDLPCSNGLTRLERVIAPVRGVLGHPQIPRRPT